MNFFDMRLLGFLGIKKTPPAPWKKYYKKTDINLNIQDENIYDLLHRNLENGKYYQKTAINYYGTKITYRELFDRIDEIEKKFLMLKVKKYDIVTIISANIPEALISIYALNKIGAVVNLLHPMLSTTEIKNALNSYHVKHLVVLDQVFLKIENVLDDTSVEKVIILSPSNSMKRINKILYNIINYKNSKIYLKNNDKYLSWQKFNNLTLKYQRKNNIVKKDDPALILQSGGTTGTAKGVILSNGNINALTISTTRACFDVNSSDVFLGIMPIFHGFGFAVSINDALSLGSEVVLIPTFKSKKFGELLKKFQPTFLVGVPTLFESLCMSKNMDDVSLYNLKYIISGGDSLNKEQIEKINNFLHEHGCRSNIIQGYGLTEAVAAASLDLKEISNPGTIGIPLPGIYINIFEPNTEKPVSYNSDGEICICGPTVMLGYFNNISETNKTLRYHRDGNIWLHTGDIGSMDKNGFITYKQRLKRMIISSGYNVYPNQIEEVILKHESVLSVSVVGIPHPYKIEVPKAYIVLKKGYHKNKKLLNSIKQLCENNLAYYAIPREFEFIDSLPKTILGKIDFKKLQNEGDSNEKKC